MLIHYNQPRHILFTPMKTRNLRFVCESRHSSNPIPVCHGTWKESPYGPVELFWDSGSGVDDSGGSLCGIAWGMTTSQAHILAKQQWGLKPVGMAQHAEARNRFRDLLLPVDGNDDISCDHETRTTDQEPRCFTLRYRATPFQSRVWQTLMNIPRGQTWTYQQLAHAIGHHNATRAVGTALGKNPFPILLPCHRVVRADGTLGHYSCGGIHNKKRILETEGVVFPR